MWKLPAAFVAWAALLPVLAMAETGKPAIDIACRMHVPAHSAPGKPVTLQFSLTNRGKQVVHVLVWNTPFEGFFGKYLQVTGPAGEVGYEGALVKRGVPDREDYRRIAPGATISKSISLTPAYDVKTPGSYAVAFTGKLHDATTGKIPRGFEEREALEISCAPVMFTVGAPAQK